MENVVTNEPDVKPGDRAEWLRQRRSYVGGSDAPVIAGLSKWKTPLQLWYEKTGVIEDDDLSDREAVHFGNVLEDTVAQEFARRTGKRVQRVNALQRHPDYEWMVGNLDRRVVGERAVLECKTTNAFSFRSDEWGEPGTDEVPEYYLIQVMHYLAVTGYDVGYLAVLVGGQRFAHYEIRRDEALIATLTDLERDFWESVQTGVMPVMDYAHPTALELMRRRYPGTNGQAIDMPESALSLRQRDEEIAAQIKALSTERDTIKAQLLDLVGEAAVALLPDGTGFTRKLIPGGKEVSYVTKDRIDFRFSKNPKVG